MAVTDHDRKVGALLGLDPARIAKNRRGAQEEADATGIPPLSRERIKEFSAFGAEITGRDAVGARSPAAGRDDCWIAACRVSHGLPLLTRNRKHFEPLEPLGLVLL